MNRLTGAALALAIVLGLLPGRGVAQISPNPKQQGQELQQVVESTFGPKYNRGYFVDVDYALETEPERFFDPQGTLQGTVLFSAIKGNNANQGLRARISIAAASRPNTCTTKPW